MSDNNHNVSPTHEHDRPLALPLNRTFLLVLIGLALLASYLGSGFYVVDTDEQGIVRRFGDIAARVGPGMHYRLPWPVDRVDVLKTTTVVKTGVGFQLPDDEQRVAVGFELLTADTNVIGLAVVLQYIVANPTDYLFQTEDPEALVSTLAEAALTEAVLRMPVDEVLTTGRLAIQKEVKIKTQQMLDRFRSGVQLISANIMSITLDRAVADAFQEVTDAMADRERFRNQALTYANNTVPKSRGRAHALIRKAKGFKEQRVAEAIGNTERFVAVLREYEKAKEITRVRLYLEAMERVLPDVKLYVIDSEGGKVPVNLRLTSP